MATAEWVAVWNERRLHSACGDVPAEFEAAYHSRLSATPIGRVATKPSTVHRPGDDLGVTYFDRRDADHLRRRLTRRLEPLAYVVTVGLKAV